MPDTVEHRVEMHRLGRARQEAGLPVWERTLDVSDVFHNDALSFVEKRDAIVRKLRGSSWLAGRDEFDELVCAVDGLEHAEDTEEFDGWWSDIYDHADWDRVWINTH